MLMHHRTLLSGQSQDGDDDDDDDDDEDSAQDWMVGGVAPLAQADSFGGAVRD